MSLELPETLLLSSGELDSASPASHETLENGIPTKVFRKDLIRLGHYKHPLGLWDLDVTDERMNKWVEAFEKMKANGVLVPLSGSHIPSSDNHLGYIKNMSVEDGKLYAQAVITGDEAITKAYRVNQVSIGLERNKKDSQGVEYGEAIGHVALTPVPVVTDQEEFRELNMGLDYVPEVKQEVKQEVDLDVVTPESMEDNNSEKSTRVDYMAIADYYTLKLDNMVLSCNITPNECRRLKELLGDNDIMCDLTQQGNLRIPMLDHMLSILADRRVTDLSENTGSQVVKRGNPLMDSVDRLFKEA
jgi:hypothetical protein